MKIPIKITPDNLTQAILNINFTPTGPIEFLYGKVFDILQDEFEYVPFGTSNSFSIDLRNSQKPIELTSSGTGIFQNGKIRFQILNNGNLLFNNWDKYLGWKIFFPEINNVLKKIHDLNIISSYKSVGIRYISEYVNESLFEKLAIDLKFVIKERNPDLRSTVLKTEINEANRKIIINLADKLERINFVINAIEQFSLIDIDVITPINTKNIEDLLAVIDESHSVEKEIFFGILKDEYINTLQPTYSEDQL